MARRKVEAVLQVKQRNKKYNSLIYSFLFKFILQQEIETNDQWTELLKRPGLIGKQGNFIYFFKSIYF